MAGNNFLTPDWTNVVSEGRNDLVFENKNKEYGAFVIRREYGKTVNKAVWISVSLFIFFLALPLISAWISGLKADEEVAPSKSVEITLTEPPPVDPTEPPPPPPPPPPVMQTIKFVPPVVTDEDVPEDEIPPPQEKLSETTVSTVTQEGDPDALNLPEVGNGNGVIEEAKEEVFTVVEQMPEFAGGVEAMYKFITNNVNYPQMAKEANVSGKVYLKFKVDKDGNISDIEVQRGIKGYPEFEQEAMRVVKKMPAWKPGKQNGRPVAVFFTLPIAFILH